MFGVEEEEGDEDEEEDGDGADGAREASEHEIECCDIIISYMELLSEVICGDLLSDGELIALLLFSVPLLRHEFARNAVTVEQCLLMSHKWQQMRMRRNRKCIEAMEEGERRVLEKLFAHLQANVLAATYANTNLAEIWKREAQQERAVAVVHEQEQDRDRDREEEEEYDEDEDIVDID